MQKLDPSAARVVPAEVLEAMARRAIRQVPITRVSEVSRLVRGALPVFSATTPLARDLTTHMGKGLTPKAARVSAIMEAVERVSAEICRGPARVASRDQLVREGLPCADPEAFDLPPATRYAPDGVFTWVEGWDLIGSSPVWIPSDLCQSPPSDGLLDQVDTNGLAAGATFGEAIRHALMEVVERDAMSQHFFFDHFGADDLDPPVRRRIDPKNLSESLTQLCNDTVKSGMRIVLDDISTDLDVPVISCLIVDEAYPMASGPRRLVFGGWGCDPSRELAIGRALTEAHQSRIGTLQGTRDSFNEYDSPAREFSRARHDAQLSPCAGHEMPGLPPGRDLSDDVELVLEGLQAIGIDSAVVVDMTDPDIGIPVVRVRVPGLSVYAVDRQRVGWRAMRHIL